MSIQSQIQYQRLCRKIQSKTSYLRFFTDAKYLFCRNICANSKKIILTNLFNSMLDV